MNRIASRLRGRLCHALRLAPVLLAVAAGPLAVPASAAPGGSVIVVTNDRGGSLGKRGELIRQLRSSGQRVELRGTCLSACTMYLGLTNLCISPSAQFGFHGPTRNGRKLPEAEFDHWSLVMARNYTPELQRWYMQTARHRTSGYYRMSGAELICLGYPAC